MSADGPAVLAPILEISSIRDGDGTWVRRVSVLEVPDCAVDSVGTDIAEDVTRVLGRLAGRLAEPGEMIGGRRLRPDLAVVLEIYLAIDG